MAITNRYTNLKLKKENDYSSLDRDSDFGVSEGRSIRNINAQNPAGIVNSYAYNYANNVMSDSFFESNQQLLLQSIISETINIHSMTVKYLPRFNKYADEMWNESAELLFDTGYNIPMYLDTVAGFEGEGDIMTQYGIEFREEVVFRVSIPSFKDQDSDYRVELSQTDIDRFARRQPLEGDLIVVPFGRNSINRNTYKPKYFEIMKVTTYHDDQFFQLGDLYQYKIKCRLFELSSEDIKFAPRVVERQLDGTDKTIISPDIGVVKSALDGFVCDSDNVHLSDSETNVFDTFGDNLVIEKEAQVQSIYNKQGEELEQKQKVLVQDYGSKAFGLPGVIDNLDNI